jgi:hypothetical protein
MLNESFSCPYFRCFPLSRSLLPCLQSTFSQLVSPTMIKDTFHALTAFVFPLSCSMLTSLYNLPSLNSFSPTPKHRATILLMPVDKGKTAFVFPLSCSLLSYNLPSFSPTLLSDTFSCPYCLCFSLLTAVRSTIFLLNSFALPSKHHPQRYFFMSHCLCFRCLAQCSPRSAIYLLSTRFHAPSKPHTQRYFFNAPAAVVFPLSCLMLSCRHLNSVSRTL